MSKENVQTVRRIYEHANATREPQAETMAPGFAWDMSTYRGAIDPGVYHGPEGTKRFLDQWLEDFDEWWIEIEDLADAGEHVVATITQHGRARHGAVVEMRLAQVWTFREDGLITRMRMYATTEEAREAAGLRRRERSD